MTRARDLFTDRQLLALTTFSDLVVEARERVVSDAREVAESSIDQLASRDIDAGRYADAVSTYLAFAVGKVAEYGNSLAVWYPKEDRPKGFFVRQAIPMVWDFPEVNPLTDIGGAWSRCVKIVSESFEGLVGRVPGTAEQRSADDLPGGVLISTDPPYYDNVALRRPFRLFLCVASTVIAHDLPRPPAYDACAKGRGTGR